MIKVSQEKYNEGLKAIDDLIFQKADSHAKQTLIDVQEKYIKDLKEGLKTIAGLGNKTGKSGEQFLADIAKNTLNKTSK